MEKLKNNTLTIFVPAYNEEKTVEKTLSKIKELDLNDMGFKKEVIVVDDGSTDNTFNIVKKFKWVKT